MSNAEPVVQTFATLASQIRALKKRRVIAVDGRSASGKTTFARHLAQALNAAVVHTDDIAWHHSFFDWWPLLIEHVLLPFRTEKNIAYTPEAWRLHGRDGAIVAPQTEVLIVEGVGSSRQERREHIRPPAKVI